jgi:K+-transporting ATPase ATPase A chain
MTIEGWILILVFTGLIALIARPVGLYLAAVYGGERTWLTPVLRPVENAFYAAACVKAGDKQGWRG